MSFKFTDFMEIMPSISQMFWEGNFAAHKIGREPVKHSTGHAF